MHKTIIKDALKECMEYSNKIMDLIKDELNKNEINFEESNEYEIIIKDNNKKNIINIILKNDNITEKNLKLLLQIIEMNGNVIIRQKSC